MDTKALRASAKASRNQLSPETIAQASLAISDRLWRLPLMSRSCRIAAYYSIGGEVDCTFAIETAWDRGRKVYLPVLRGQELIFAPYFPDSDFLRNQHGIPEPISPKGLLFRPHEMDIVLAPLVAFDARGNRVGMGGGYYDRSFRFMRHRKQWTRPRLVGLAYEFQKVPQLKACSWDVPLHNAVTEKQTYTF
ncbi:MAG: 5-formyltetrahydrofolate cyclo-ligase [Gammaproteobacteria bacterium]|jgi:5-formyltetrahydrofolate cyclo-ligase|nr:5-formyltetrahydrofolate cyclo-ligase [Gammaproteobacteria bacterium]